MYRVLFLILGALFLGCDLALAKFFAPLNRFVWPPLALLTLAGFFLALLKPKWVLSFLLFLAPWLVAVPLLASNGNTHPMHIFVLLAVLAGFCWREVVEKDGNVFFCGYLGWLVWFGVVLAGVWASLSRYCPEFALSDPAFFSQIINDKDWDRRKALTYIVFNASGLLAGLALIYASFRAFAREKLGEPFLESYWRLWLAFASGCTLAIAAAFVQRHYDIQFCANRSFYWVRMGRVNGTCQDPNALGVTLGLAFAFGVSFLSSWKKGVVKLILLLVWLTLCAFAINYSGSRSGFLAIALSLFFLLVGYFVNTRLILKARPLLRLAAVLAALLVLACGAGMYSMSLVQRADKILTGTTKSPALQRRLKKDIRSMRNAGSVLRIFNDARRQVYPRFAQIVADDTWPSGIGIGSFVVELPNYALYEEENLRAPDNACNFYLQVKAESGLFGSLGLALFIGGIVLAFAVSWFRQRGDAAELGRLWTVTMPLLVFALLLFLGVHQEVMEVSFPWHIFLGVSIGYLTLSSSSFLTLHGEARFMGILTALILIGLSFFCYRRLNSGNLNTERRLASIRRPSEIGFYAWENWHAQSKTWRWCGKEGLLSVKKMNDYASFDLISNFPGLTNDPQRVTVFVNGAAATNVTLALPGNPCHVKLPVGYALPFDSVDDQFVTIRLSCANTWSPSDYGVEGDSRKLGVAVSHIRWSSENTPEGGFYGKERDPNVGNFAWTKGQAHFEYLGRNRAGMEISLRALNPLLRFFPLSAALYVNGYYLDTVVLSDSAWRNFTYEIPDDIPLRNRNLVEVIPSREWRPRHYGFQDDRLLGVAVSLKKWQEQEGGE